jgi:hypothetical protein
MAQLCLQTGYNHIMKKVAPVALLLLIIISFFLVLSPSPAAAQKEDTGLVLMFIPGANFDRLTPGTAGISYLEIRNTDDKPVSGIMLSSDHPPGWQVEFNPDLIQNLNAGGVTTVDVKITPPASADRGDYRFTAIAETDGMRRITSIYVNVQPSNGVWLWIGLALATLLIAGFILVFVRLGK